MIMKKRLLSFVTALVLLVAPFVSKGFAANSIDQWAMSDLVDLQSQDFPIDSVLETIRDNVSASSLETLKKGVETKLGFISSKTADAPVPQQDSYTRGEVLNFIYSMLKGCDYGAEVDFKSDCIEFFASAGVLKGDETGYMQDRICTNQEAFVFAARSVAYIYNVTDNASEGIMWKVNTGAAEIYLLGTIHVDAGNIYPFDYNIVNAVSESDKVIFELDFGDFEGQMYYMANIVYTDGTTLKDHIPDELYQKVAAIYAENGKTEQDFINYRPWVVASELANMVIYSGETDRSNPPMVIDTYIHSKALAEGKNIGEIEGWKYQCDLLNGMSDELQIEYLRSGVEGYYSGGDETGEANATKKMMETWKNGDEQGFNEIYGKDKALASGDEFTKLLFVERDAHMTEYVLDKLTNGGGKTYFIAVGLGHMVGQDGIVSELRERGYTVERVK